MFRITLSKKWFFYLLRGKCYLGLFYILLSSTLININVCIRHCLHSLGSPYCITFGYSKILLIKISNMFLRGIITFSKIFKAKFCFVLCQTFKRMTRNLSTNILINFNVILGNWSFVTNGTTNDWLFLKPFKSCRKILIFYSKELKFIRSFLHNVHILYFIWVQFIKIGTKLYNEMRSLRIESSMNPKAFRFLSQLLKSSYLPIVVVGIPFFGFYELILVYAFYFWVYSILTLFFSFLDL